MMKNKKASPLKFQTIMSTMVATISAGINSGIEKINELGKPRPQVNDLCEFSETCRPVFVLEKHMTVIRKGPTMPLDIELYQFADGTNTNYVTEGVATKAVFYGSYMDSTHNYTEDIDTLLAGNWPPLQTGYGRGIDGSNISAFYTRNKVQKKAGDEVIIPIDITQSGEDWEANDQLIIKHDYDDGFGNIKTATCRCQIITAAQTRWIDDGMGGEDWVSPSWSPYSHHSTNPPTNFPSPGTKATWGMYKLPGDGADKFVHAKIMSMSGNFPILGTKGSHAYEVELVQIEPLFKVKFPRFSYRYKYEDGEYSVFAPWSEIAFVPTGFDYSPKKGYNLGMENALRLLKVLNWRPSNCPKDVVQIDILYKESNSPNVYTVETFQKDDPIPAGETQNYWDTPANGSHFGKYTIKTELIHKVVASNQLLRPWDNVPRKAIAQEVTANRLIFANYLQQYNVEKIDSLNERVSIKPSFFTQVEELNPWGETDAVEDNGELGQPVKSLKSQRTYQLGVVYRDKYGRETPVLTSKSGSVDIQKRAASLQNRLNVRLMSDPPYWAESYTFYIKETSNEYYNLAMDRWYNAKDGGVWLSFPSSERNKITEDSNLILKKKHDSNAFTEYDVSYKVLSIKNNAPKFIKTDAKYWGSAPIMLPPPGWGHVGNWDTGMLHPTGLPLPNRMNIDVIAEYFDSTMLKGLSGFNGAQIRITQSPGVPSAYNDVASDLTNYTNWYDVANISYIGPPTETYFDENGFEQEVQGQATRLVRIALETAFGDDALFCVSDSVITPFVVNTANSNISMARGLSIEARTMQEKEKAQFQGRFFVKVLRDANVEANIVQSQRVEGDKYQVLQSKDLKYICVAHPGTQDWNHDPTYYIPPNLDWASGVTQDRTHLVSSYGKYAGRLAPYLDSAVAVQLPPSSSPYWPYGPSNFTDGVFTKPGPDGNWWNNVNADLGYLSGNPKIFPDTSPSLHGWPSYGPKSLAWAPPAMWGLAVGEKASVSAGTMQYDYLSATSYPDGAILDLSMGCDAGGTGNGQTAGDCIADPIHTWTYTGGIGTEGAVIAANAKDSKLYPTAGNPFALPAVWGNQGDLLSDPAAAGGAWPQGKQPYYDLSTMTKLRVHWYSLWRGRDDILSDWPLGRFHPDRWFIDKAGAASGGSGAGIWDDGNVSFMQVSYWGVGSEASYNRESNTVLAAKHQPSELLFADAMATVGTMFRFKQDPDQIVYTITRAEIEPDIWNYESPVGSWGYSDDGTEVKGGGGMMGGLAPPFGGYVKGSNLAGATAFISDVVERKTHHTNRAKLTGGAPYNRRVRYTITLDKIIGTEGPSAFHPITNHVDVDGLSNIKRGRMKYSTDLPNLSTTYGATPPSQSWYNLNSYWNAANGAGGSINSQPNDINDSYYTNNPKAYIGLHERGLNETTIEVISLYTGKDRDFPMSNNPAIWETEPKEDVGLDIYYAASPSYPIQLKRHRWDGNLTGADGNTGSDEVDASGANWYDFSHRSEEIIKVGSTVIADGFQEMKICAVKGDVIFFDRIIEDDADVLTDLGVGMTLKIIWQGEGTYYGATNDTEWVEVTVTEVLSNSAYRIGDFNNLQGHTHQVLHGLGYFNCYSYGTGVESNRIRDDFNAITIDKGIKASMPLAEQFKEERKGSGLIFSGIYNSTSGVNRTNEFIQAEPITKDLNPINGSIQKLFARDTDLVTFCENKVFKILAKKDALFNADGNTNVTSNQAVLGQSIPFGGEYGISKNPESFAQESYRLYFTDRDRGSVLRLSKDGLTPISDAGMKDWFRDNLRFSKSLRGSYDDRDNQYNLTIETMDQDANEKAYTVSYTEKTRGWVSFKSFVQQGGISHKNTYYTFPSNKYNRITANNPWGHAYGAALGVLDYTAEIYQHSLDIDLKRLVTSNSNGSPNIVVTDGQGTILPGMNVEGDGIPTDTRVDLVNCDGSNCLIQLNFGIGLQTGVWIITNTELTFTTARNRFYDVDSYSMVKVLFNGAQGTVKRFKTLNYEGTQARVTQDTSNLHQIIDPSTMVIVPIGQDYYDNHHKLGWRVHNIYTDLQEGQMAEFIDKENKWFNYVRGYSEAGDGDFLDTGEFSLQGLGFTGDLDDPIYGCTDISSPEYDDTANIDDGSCWTGAEGCTDPNALNFNASALDDDGSCILPVYGCTDITAFNFDPLQDPVPNVDDGSCYPVIIGCLDTLAFNYITPSGSPQLDVNTACVDDSGAPNGYDGVNCCIDVIPGCTDPTAMNYNALANTDDGTCEYCIYGCMDAVYDNYDANAT